AMAGLIFGGTTADWVAVPHPIDRTTFPAFPRGAVTVTCWDAETGGSKIAITDPDTGDPLDSTIAEPRTGKIRPVRAPDGVTALWWDAGGGARWRALPAEGPPVSQDVLDKARQAAQEAQDAVADGL